MKAKRLNSDSKNKTSRRSEEKAEEAKKRAKEREETKHMQQQLAKEKQQQQKKQGQVFYDASWMSFTRQRVSRSLIWRSENLAREGEEREDLWMLLFLLTQIPISTSLTVTIPASRFGWSFQKNLPLSFKPTGGAFLNHVLFISNREDQLIHVYFRRKALSKRGSYGSTRQFKSPML